jgi:hypothetical protein
MSITIAISYGEALDRFSILSIKSEFILDPVKQLNIQYEIKLLLKSMGVDDVRDIKYKDLYTELYNVNKKIWIISDLIREKKEQKDLWEIHVLNDERFKIKSEINSRDDSDLKEHKSYTKLLC